jgi:hypothetical protein
MYFSNSVIALVATLSTASAQGLKGFNWGATHTDNSPMTEADYTSQFKLAQGLVGATGFTSARLYTTIVSLFFFIFIMIVFIFLILKNSKLALLLIHHLLLLLQFLQTQNFY